VIIGASFYRSDAIAVDQLIGFRILSETAAVGWAVDDGLLSSHQWLRMWRRHHSLMDSFPVVWYLKETYHGPGWL